MKGEDLSQRATQALQPFRHLGTPVEDDVVVAARREELIPLIGSSIRVASVSRIRWRRGKSALALAAIAAGLALVVTQSHRALTSDDQPAVSRQQAGSSVLSAGGAVSLTRQGRPIGASAQPRQLLAGDQVATPPNTPASLVLVGGARAEVGPSTQITLARTEPREQRLELVVGRVDLEIPKLEPGSAFVVETPHAEVRVRGTRFSVEVSAAGADAGITRVGVSRGSVLVRTARGDHMLSGGEAWSSLLAPATLAEPAQHFAVGDPAAGDRPSSAVVSSQGGPEALRDTRGSTTTVKNTAPSRAVAERAALGSDPPRSRSDTRSPTRGRADEGSGARSPADTDALARQNGLMQAALAARSTGDHARAVRLLDELLRLHPSSPLTESARVERFRSLRRLGRHAEATREARRYLAIHGRGFARDEARDLVLEPGTASSSAPKR